MKRLRKLLAAHVFPRRGRKRKLIARLISSAISCSSDLHKMAARFKAELIVWILDDLSKDSLMNKVCV